jgi:hypothetical protein
MPRKIIIYKNGVDVSNDCSLENKKSNPFGWSQCEVHHAGERIGWMESGSLMDFVDGYTFDDKEISQEEYDNI